MGHSQSGGVCPVSMASCSALAVEVIRQILVKPFGHELPVGVGEPDAPAVVRELRPAVEDHQDCVRQTSEALLDQVCNRSVVSELVPDVVPPVPHGVGYIVQEGISELVGHALEIAGSGGCPPATYGSRPQLSCFGRIGSGQVGCCAKPVDERFDGEHPLRDCLAI